MSPDRRILKVCMLVFEKINLKEAREFTVMGKGILWGQGQGRNNFFFLSQEQFHSLSKILNDVAEKILFYKCLIITQNLVCDNLVF